MIPNRLSISQMTTVAQPPDSNIQSKQPVKGRKKAKGRVFQCTGYPGCNMTFTRSEHLARHIRKHTGERPFECEHCGKKFSRLDNLRQHKQTVHMYENFVLSYPDQKVNVRVKNDERERLYIGVNPATAQPITPVMMTTPQYATHHQSQQQQQQQYGQSYPLSAPANMLSPPNSTTSNPVIVQPQSTLLPPPRRSLLNAMNNEFRPNMSNKPRPIVVSETDINQQPNSSITPTSAPLGSVLNSPIPTPTSSVSILSPMYSPLTATYMNSNANANANANNLQLHMKYGHQYPPAAPYSNPNSPYGIPSANNVYLPPLQQMQQSQQQQKQQSQQLPLTPHSQIMQYQQGPLSAQSARFPQFQPLAAATSHESQLPSAAAATTTTTTSTTTVGNKRAASISATTPVSLNSKIPPSSTSSTSTAAGATSSYTTKSSWLSNVLNNDEEGNQEPEAKRQMPATLRSVPTSTGKELPIEKNAPALNSGGFINTIEHNVNAGRPKLPALNELGL